MVGGCVIRGHCRGHGRDLVGEEATPNVSEVGSVFVTGEAQPSYQGQNAAVAAGADVPNLSSKSLLR